MENNWPEKQNKEEYIDKIRNELTPEQFLREYLCEHKIKSLPSIVEFQNGERLEWQEFANTSQPIISVDLEAVIDFIPSKIPHRLHNHPRMEVELGISEKEVIVDQEFVHLFKNAYPVRGRRREVGVDHFIVSKKEFMEVIVEQASDVIEHWLVKHGMEAHPNEWCAELLEKKGEKIEYCDDGIHYIRKINGVPKVKAIYGNLCDSRINYNS